MKLRGGKEFWAIRVSHGTISNDIGILFYYQSRYNLLLA